MDLNINLSKVFVFDKEGKNYKFYTNDEKLDQVDVFMYLVMVHN